MRLEKFIAEGGNLELRELKDKFGIQAKEGRAMLDRLFPDVKRSKMSGHTEEYPR